MLRRLALVGAATLILVGTTAAPAAATIPGDGGAACNSVDINVQTSLAGTSYKLLIIVQGTGSCGIRAYAHCSDFGDTGYAYGAAVSAGQTSTANCHSWKSGGYLYGNSGFEWYDGNAWHRHVTYTA
jgi:hypothetical protein